MGSHPVAIFLGSFAFSFRFVETHEPVWVRALSSAPPAPSRLPECIDIDLPACLPACLLACLPAAVRLYADSYVNEEALATLVALSGICVVIALAPGTKAHLACTPVSIQMAFDELTALTSKVLDAAPIFRSPVPAQAR